MLQVVWFRRDVRLLDHQPLVEALRYGEPILPIYIADPSLWKNSELSVRHLQFIMEGLTELQESFHNRNGTVYVSIQEVEDVLATIYEAFGEFTIHTYAESGTTVMNERNMRVHKWMESQGLQVKEYQQDGVVKGHDNRGTLRKEWNAYMDNSLYKTPAYIPTVDEEEVPSILSSSIDKMNRLSVGGMRIKYGQQGGESLALESLETFLSERSKRYKDDLADPVSSSTAGSRLSPYLAWGNISLRYVVQRTNEKISSIEEEDHVQQLKAFLAHLFWHSQYKQWLLDDPLIACESIDSALDDVREDKEETFQKWCEGETGIPMIDAAMMLLLKTGWINNQLRAMLISFTCHTLGLDWRRPADYLAGLFLDYVPGIHYSQTQLTVGTTDAKSVKVLNPIKLGKNLDPEGTFVRRHIPALKHVPNKYVHEPWKYHGFVHIDYGEPMIDVQEANRRAKEVILSVKGSTNIKRKKTQKKESSTREDQQLSLNLFDS
ncbi:deoxyribodipyrimidine photolyase [Pontibacillus yanchengensis Y32]|uniref:Deoxyribodipyrimidine photolyase n=1 Tax=Pontibacillus yanchengensis Y32 TaxID=1385514 RepID=A0A0A2TIH1_9BACI|nr:deoxyribodipyrimidine photolyase [Pontibacillus yanchengensis Y32]